MKNLRIGLKLAATFSIIVIMFLFTVGVSIYGLVHSERQFKDFYEYSYPSSEKTLDIRRGLQAAIKGLGLSMLTEDDGETNRYISEVEEEMKGVRDNFDWMLKNYRGDTSRIQAAISKLDQATDYRTEIQTLSAEHKVNEAKELFFNQYNPIIVEVTEAVISMDDNTSTLADTTYTSARETQISVIVIVVAISVVALIITVILSIYLTRGIRKPIEGIENAAKSMASGKLDVSVEYESRDELGGLSDSIRSMIYNLKTIIGDVDYLMGEMAEGNFAIKTTAEEIYTGDFNNLLLSIRKMNRRLSSALSQIYTAAEQVSSGSDQVSTASQTLSEGATEQASAIEELAATINEISQQAKETAENAAAANVQTRETGADVMECNRQMQELIAAMDDISQRSGEIGKIIKTIEDIAFQTNILALNAAVEAARAGAAGKGFAVVADEVRNLASKSAEASKNTAALIEGSVAAVEKGTELVNGTAGTLLKVVESAQSITANVDKIAKAANMQTEAVNQVTQGIDQIATVIQINSATAEESAAASEELSGQADIMKNLAGQFKLNGAGSLETEGQSKINDGGGVYPASAPAYVTASASEKY